MRAASIKSFGIAVPMYWRIRKMPSAPAAPGTYRARGWSSHPRKSISMKVGIMFMKDGMIIDAITSVNKGRLKRNSYMAKA